MDDSTWFELAAGHGVLELPERITKPGPALELHIIVPSDDSPTSAWWLSDDGSWLRAAEIAVA